MAALLDCVQDGQPRAAEGSMIRTLFLVISILAVAVMPNPAHGGGGGHGGHGHHHRHHHGHRHFHHFGGFFVVSYVYAPYLYYPYPVYPPPAVLEEPPVVYQPPAVQREVIYPNVKYVLYGDGVNQPYQWVWDPGCPASPVAATVGLVSRDQGRDRIGAGPGSRAARIDVWIRARELGRAAEGKAERASNGPRCSAPSSRA